MSDDTNVAEAPHLILDFGDDDQGLFRAHKNANAFLLHKHLDDVNGPPLTSLRAILTLAVDQVVPEERERLEQFLQAHGRDENFSEVLWDGLDAVWRGETMLPLPRPSSSGADTSTTETEDSSTDDLPSPATAA